MQVENLVRIQGKFKASPERLFQALLESQPLTKCFCEFADVSPTAKAYDFWGRFTPEAPADQKAGHHPLTLLATNRHLAYKWTVYQADTQVLFKLLPRQDETVLTLRQTGSAALSPDRGRQIRDYWFLSLENLRRYLDGKTAAARVDFSRPMQGDIRHELIVDAPASRVFETIIRPDQINQWIGNGAAVEPKPGGSYSFGWMGMKILEIVPDKKLSVSPTYDNNGVEEITPHAFTWTLEESSGKTRLTFVHSGFAPDESTEDASLGWLSYMSRLRSLAEYGSDWQHPLVPVEPELIFMYPVGVVQGQVELLDDLLAESDPLLAAVERFAS
jgi:uncharacterized protein YndB with AHSA1/START domain